MSSRGSLRYLTAKHIPQEGKTIGEINQIPGSRHQTEAQTGSPIDTRDGIECIYRLLRLTQILNKRSRWPFGGNMTTQ